MHRGAFAGSRRFSADPPRGSKEENCPRASGPRLLLSPRNFRPRGLIKENTSNSFPDFFLSLTILSIKKLYALFLCTSRRQKYHGQPSPNGSIRESTSCDARIRPALSTIRKLDLIPRSFIFLLALFGAGRN